MAGQFAEQLGGLVRERRLRADGEAVLQLGLNGLDHEVRRMAKSGLAIAVDEIDIGVAVDIPDPGTLRPGGDDRVDHFLPVRCEAGDGARIGQNRTVLVRQPLRGRGLADIELRQPVDMAALGLGQGFVACADQRLEARRGTGGTACWGRGSERWQRLYGCRKRQSRRGLQDRRCCLDGRRCGLAAQGLQLTLHQPRHHVELLAHERVQA